MKKKPIQEVLPPGQIKAKAMCLIIHDGKLLATKGRDSAAGENFYRVLGGGIEFGETSEQAVRREIKEELKSGIVNLERIDVIENIFSYEGKPGHQIIFLFKGELDREDLLHVNNIRIEENIYEQEAAWVNIKDILDGKVILYPKFDYSKALSKS